MSQREHLVYVLRPDRTALWLPALLAAHLGVEYGHELTEAQYGCEDIQQLIANRRAAEGDKARS